MEKASAPCRHGHCHGTGAFQCESNTANVCMQLPVLVPLLVGCPIPMVWGWRWHTALCFWDMAPSGHGLCLDAKVQDEPVWPQHASTTHKMHLQGAISEVHLPKVEKPPQGRCTLMYQVPRTVWWHPRLVIFSLFFLFHSQISSYPNAAKKKLTTPNTGNTHMIFAADHILPNLSSSWPTQHMSLQRTIHPLPKGV